MGLPDGIRKIVENYLQYGKTFRIEVSSLVARLIRSTEHSTRDTIFKLSYGVLIRSLPNKLQNLRGVYSFNASQIQAR